MSRPARGPHRMKGISIDFAEPVPVEAPEPLRVEYLAGSGTRLVVSLAGVGTVRNGVPPREFTSSASCGGENHVLFISDVSRSWLNGPGLAEQIVELVDRICDENGLTEVVGLGNSMGGFSVLVLAEMLALKTVISLAPQFSMHPDVMPDEPRWNWHRDRIAEWRFRDVGALDRTETDYYIFHGDNPLEARHWQLFPQDERLHHFIFEGAAHDLAARMRKRKVLNPVISAAIEGRPRVVRKTMERSMFGRQFSVYRREAYDNRLTGDPEGRPDMQP